MSNTVPQVEASLPDIVVAPAASEPSSRKLFFTVFPSIVLPMFLAAVDGTIVAAALPAMASSLGDVEQVSGVVVAYLVAATVAAPVYGRLGDALGRRRMLIVALAMCLVSHILCAIAPTMALLIAARVLQGLGGGGLMTLSQALIGQVVPPRERGRYQGYTASVFVTSSMFGPVAGGWLTQQFGWRAVFFITIPIVIAAQVMAQRLPKQDSPRGRLNFDVLGTLLFAGFIVSALMALELVKLFVWSVVPGALALAASAVICLVLLLRQERRVSAPLLPVAFLRQTAVWRTDTMAFFVGAVLVSMITFLPIYFTVARGAGPGEVGLMMLPLTGFIAVGSMITGRIMSKTGRTALIPSIGMPILTVLLVVLAVFGPSISLSRLPWLLGAISLFTGSAMPVVQLTLQMLAGPKMLGVAAASVQFSRSIGAATGTAVVGAVLFATLAATDLDTASLFNRIVEIGPSAVAALAPERLAVVQAEIATAFRMAFLTIAGFAAISALLAWSIPVRRLS